MHDYRCTNRFNDLDRPGPPIFRTHEHYSLAAAAKSATQLCHEYGYSGSTRVCVFRIFTQYTLTNIHFIQLFTESFPGPSIYEIIAPDILHQIIKGTFKDHLVTWIEEYFVIKYGKKGAYHKMGEIDRRYVS
jgi:hypothetical protein